MKYDAWDVCATAYTDKTLTEIVLTNRGISSPAEIDAFLHPSAEHLHDPFLLDGMETAVRRIQQAAASGERVAVYGDYDADGVTATCILVLFLRSWGLDCLYYIPDRLCEGYGLHAAALEALAQKGVTLLITVDTGVTALAETALAARLGMDVIVTDHHACRDEWPAALAVLHPGKPGYPFPHLAGAGVAYKLVCALTPPAQRDALLARYGALAALGTVADVVPLTGENRALVSLGLEAAFAKHNPGLWALIQAAGVSTGAPLKAASVAYALAPRINAAGRLAHADRAVALLLTGDDFEASRLAAFLCDLNQKRQTLERGITEQAFDLLRDSQGSRPDLLPPAVVLAHEGWHLGVLGIAAAKMAERLRRPVFLLTLADGMARGSARGAQGVDLAKALSCCAPLLTAFGGHAQAAGLSLPEGNVPALREKLSELLRDGHDGAPPKTTLSIDACLPPESLTLANARALACLEPFGAGNPQPVFLWEGALLETAFPVSEGRHMRLGFRGHTGVINAIAFGFAQKDFPFRPGDRLDAAFYLEENVFRGQSSLQLRLCDLRPARA